MPPRLTYKLNPYEQTTCPVQRVRIDVKVVPRLAIQTGRRCINTPLLTGSQGFGIWTLTGAKHSCSSAHSFEHSIRAFGKAGIASAAQFKSQSARSSPEFLGRVSYAFQLSPGVPIWMEMWALGPASQGSDHSTVS